MTTQATLQMGCKNPVFFTVSDKREEKERKAMCQSFTVSLSGYIWETKAFYAPSVFFPCLELVVPDSNQHAPLTSSLSS